MEDRVKFNFPSPGTRQNYPVFPPVDASVGAIQEGTSVPKTYSETYSEKDKGLSMAYLLSLAPPLLV